jgi:hypothetical protein
LVAVQGRTTRGELTRVTGLGPGRAQAIVSGVSALTRTLPFSVAFTTA